MYRTEEQKVAVNESIGRKAGGAGKKTDRQALAAV